jgi:hypothetical protein
MSKINIPGKVGINCEVGNAHTVEIRSSHNGAGDDEFGGAREWPTVWAQIQFQTGDERRALDFARKLSDLIKSEFSS